MRNLDFVRFKSIKYFIFLLVAFGSMGLLYLLFSIPSARAVACGNPLIYNEFGVPVNYYGGLIFVNGTKFPSSQKLIPFNLSAYNPTLQSMTFELDPSASLFNYVYGTTVTLAAKEKRNFTINVYVDDGSKEGSLAITGACQNGIPIPEGFISFNLQGRGNAAPQTCSNSRFSCGVYPDCQDLTGFSGCYQGYNRVYSCSQNKPKYSQSCSNFCCREYYGSEASCKSINGISTCVGPAGCTNECSFSGNLCDGNNIYSCNVGEDGCRHLSLQQSCGTDICSNGSCLDPSSFKGKIAMLCRDSTCTEGIEGDLKTWLSSKNWLVTGKAYNKWTSSELDGYDLMVCTDENTACKSDAGSIIHNKHKLQGKPFVEVSDYRNVYQGFKFGYTSNFYTVLATGSDLVITDAKDLITKPFGSKVRIFNSGTTFIVLADYFLKGGVKDLADVQTSSGKTTLFKISESGSRGRYAYVGWFYKSSMRSMTEQGSELLERVFTWASCGDSCLSNSPGNDPPLASYTANPYPTAYVNQLVTFDASSSEDPESAALQYFWDFGDGATSGWISSPTITHSYSIKGDYTIALKVSDGQLESDPYTTMLSVLPLIQHKVAFICGEATCSETSELRLIEWLRGEGYEVVGKTQSKWTLSELDNYDFMACSSAVKGCSLRSYYAPYIKHKSGRLGLLEVPDYQYVRAGKTFDYASSYSGMKESGKNIKKVVSDQITSPFGSIIQIKNADASNAGIISTRLSSGSVNIAELSKIAASTMFKVDASGMRGRYAYVGWLYKSNPFSDLTSDGEALLLRTVRWVQCGNADGC